jgi:GNAT superfamily N-acetyltransferase
MLDLVFFSGDNPAEQRDFLSLLPKLYKEQYKPWENNYCVFEGDRPVAAVGMYVNEMNVAGETIRLGGIGNVAVAPDCRSKGYMKLTMDFAMQAMKDKGCDFAELSGDRHRYRYWGFEKGGVKIEASFSAMNLRHAFGKGELAAGWSAKPVLADDTAALAQIQAFLEGDALHLKHDANAMHDILSSWRERPYAIWFNEKLAGTFSLSFNGSQALRLQICDWVGSLEMPLRAVLAALPENSVVYMAIPAWRHDLISKMEAVTENFCLNTAGQYCVLNWENVLRAGLKLQGRCKALLDGRITVLVHGFNGDEKLSIEVKEGQVAVEKFTGTADLELDHLDAQTYFLGPVSAARQCPVMENWFPLPVMIWGFDTV